MILSLSCLLALAVADARACPFCTVPRPTLAERRDQAEIVALAQVESTTPTSSIVRLHQLLKGQLERDRALSVPVPAGAASGSLVLMLGRRIAGTQEDELSWELIPVDEFSYGYFVRSPSTRLPAHERMPYFCRFLEHPDPLVAEDAYAEFGRAPYDEVAKIADQLSQASFRRWLVDDQVPGERKGFYGLALGLARDPRERAENEALLHAQIEQASSDFRAGFDGILGGYMLLAGEPGLAWLEARYLNNPAAAQGDLIHLHTALRFYHEFGRAIPADRLAAALERLLDRPSLAAPVIIDLARWQDWAALPKVVALAGRPGYEEPTIRRAIIGYLEVCPQPQAAAALEKLEAAKAKPE
jgi:hypothetical protein